MNGPQVQDTKEAKELKLQWELLQTLLCTFWECVEAHGESYNPTHGSNHRYWEQIVPVELEDNDLIIFFGSSNATYNNKIWEVGGVGSSITLTERYNFDGSNGAIQLNDGEKNIADFSIPLLAKTALICRSWCQFAQLYSSCKCFYG